jgi:hypothetical protein
LNDDSTADVRGETAVEEPFAQHHLHLRKSAGFVGQKGLRELI